MVTDNALNQRRHKRHRAGDHSLCSPLRCAYARAETPFEQPPAAEDEPTPLSVVERYGFGALGRDLWHDVTTETGALTPHAAILLVEACRIADRLDQLNRQLRGEDWLRFRVNTDDDGDTRDVIVYCDRVLSEARGQADTLKALVAQIHTMTNAQKQPELPVKVADGVANLRDRILARRDQA